MDLPNDEIPELGSAEKQTSNVTEVISDPEPITKKNNENSNNDPMISNEINVETVESNPDTNTIKAETIEINLSTKDIQNNLQSQPRKNWRFHLKNSNDALTKELESILNGITVEYNIKKETPDIILKEGDDVLGKINLLLCDRRHINEPANYYCKIHLFEFKDRKIFEAVKNKLTAFFNNLKSNTTNNSKPPKNNTNNPTNPNSVGGRYRKSKGRRTHKKKRVLKRKKTIKRK